MVNWDPPKPAGWRQAPDPTMTEEYVPGRPFAIFIQVSNRGRFCQYIKFTNEISVSGSTLQYKVEVFHFWIARTPRTVRSPA